MIKLKKHVKAVKFYTIIMKSFPLYLTPANIDKLPIYKRNREICYLRRHTYETMLSGEFKIPENCGVNIQNVPTGDSMGITFSPSKEAISIVCEELKSQGFSTTLAYGDTMIFIHTADTQPKQLVICKGFD